ncbi:MAG: zinc ribbon domain-containing protein [Spirochaetaceae bacterium]|nr:zinc ribbon domain-containing protein [Spirochaetaceae bacterium]
MAFCSKCGKELAEGARFCSGCGASVGGAVENDGTKRVQKFVGEIRKCPGCGAVLQSFQAICPECGMELRGNVDSVSSVKQFADKLMKIESARGEVDDSAGSQFLAQLGLGQTKINKTDSAIINLIKTFPVPNTIEDIMEFMLLAENNLDVSAFNLDLLSSTSAAKSVAEKRTEKETANAWLSKMEQVYKKAELSFSASPIFHQVKDLYERKKKKVEKAKKIKLGLIIGIVVLFIVLCVVMIYLEEAGYY